MNRTKNEQELAAEVGLAIAESLKQHGVAILPPIEATESIRLLSLSGVSFQSTVLDPWYNKGIGGVRDDYHDFVVQLFNAAAKITDHLFFWGFPEITAQFAGSAPPDFSLIAWLTWYYKNSPSVIRGWRSSQMACLHFGKENAKMYPEHFFNAAQNARLAEGKLRYMPGPTSVIEESLLCGFVGRNEQTGHPAQKPVRVFETLIKMTTKQDELIFDPMCGAGTTAEAARNLGRCAIVSDYSEEYIKVTEERLGVKRITVSMREGFALKNVPDSPPLKNVSRRTRSSNSGELDFSESLVK